MQVNTSKGNLAVNATTNDPQAITNCHKPQHYHGQLVSQVAFSGNAVTPSDIHIPLALGIKAVQANVLPINKLSLRRLRPGCGLEWCKR